MLAPASRQLGLLSSRSSSVLDPVDGQHRRRHTLWHLVPSPLGERECGPPAAPRLVRVADALLGDSAVAVLIEPDAKRGLVVGGRFDLDLQIRDEVVGDLVGEQSVGLGDVRAEALFVIRVTNKPAASALLIRLMPTMKSG